MLPELDLLINRVDHDWNALNRKAPQVILDLLFSYKEEQLSIEQRYTGSMYLPASNHCKRLANKDLRDFNVRFEVKSKERADENVCANTETAS